MHLTRRLLLGGLLATPALRAWGEAPETSIRPAPRAPDFFKQAIPDAEALIQDARLGGKVSFAIADLAQGDILEARQPLLTQPPASTTKALTALYALEALGPEHRFQTRLIATGPIANGRIDGDLILAGGGDPTLDTDALADMAADLKKIGVREVAGRFRVWDGALPNIREIDPEQPDHVGYNPAVGGLNLNYNRVHFEWRRAGGEYTVSMDARSARYQPDVTMARMAVVDRSVPIYTYADRDGTDAWTVAKGALGSGGARWLPVRRPAVYAGEVFRTLARAHGIQLGGAVGRADGDTGTTLVTRDSAALPEVLRDMLKYSTNLTAEAVGMAASAKRGGTVRDLVASAGRMDDWLIERAALRSPQFVDHSGLGDTSRIHAADMVKALVSLGPDSGLRPLLKTYDLDDLPDTKIQAKTGTLNFVAALVGFVTAPSGRDMAFAIYCADIPRRDALSEAEMDSPPGGVAWVRRARHLQWQLLSRWSKLYG
ncbi:D-alanyl-D-alanine carboxypeptidase/D-alanyl-D-alanine endopeptidase [Oceaniglobus indicus]|uniref:D-alanyl-D-alanine carboxypeptidase/D-alanyl-D-alanine endopeptidase n=1 Tax=Oceaniglobus indicus TaxID=2047749 RepID=UPI000C179B9D|nr:D-alanyl-D-alanine carboxypeptidase/D-alanyl-D-alanine-endopeptidase [Oceaniglobus indicus]